VSKDEGQITKKKDILQINATLITGILVFLSIYSNIGSKVIFDISNKNNNEILKIPFSFIYFSIISFMITILFIITSMLSLLGKTINILKSERLLSVGLITLLFAIIMLIIYLVINLFNISSYYDILIPLMLIIIPFIVVLLALNINYFTKIKQLFYKNKNNVINYLNKLTFYIKQ
jgi:hypothetical protein